MGDLSRSLLTGEDDPTVEAQNALELPPGGQGISDVLLGRNPDGRLRLSMEAAQKKNPDTEARVLRLQARTGLPPDLIERNLDEVERQAARADFDPHKFRRESPIVADWLAQNPSHAAVARDDVHNLSRLELLLRATPVALPGGGVSTTAFRRTTDVGRAFAGEAIRTPGMALAGLGELYEAATGLVERGIRAVPGGDPVADFLTETQIPWWLNPTEILRRPGTEIKAAGEDVKPPEERQDFVTDVAGGLGQLSAQIAAAVLLGPAATTTGLFGMGADIQAERAQEAGATREEEDAAVIAGAGVTALTERLGLDALLSRVPPAIKNRIMRQLADVSLAGGIEAVQEAIEGVWQNIITAAIYNPQQDILEGIEQEAGTAGVVGAIGRGLLNAMLPGRQAVQARQDADRLQRLSEAAQASTLRQRSPELFEQLVRNMSGDEARAVYAPVEAWDTLFQSNPEAAAEELLGSVEAYREAKATGGDIVIPIEVYAARIAPTEVNASLLPELRFTVDGMNLREAEEFEARREEIIGETMAALGEQGRPADDTSGQVYEDVLGQLLGSGVERSAAERQATLVQSVFRTLGQRTGIDPLALYERYGFEVRREIPEALRPFAEVDTDLDPLIDRLRAGDIPSQTDIFGESLLEMLRARGGLQDEGGELSARGRVGERRLVSEDGMSLDEAAEWAQQLGYIPERDINLLLEAIDEELRGEPVFSDRNIDQRLFDERQALEQLDEELSRAGIDVAKVSNETIKAFLRGEVDEELVAQRAALDPDGITYDQAGQLQTDEAPGVVTRLLQRAVDLIAPPDAVTDGSGVAAVRGRAYTVDGEPVIADPDTPRGVAIRSLAEPRRFPLDLVLDTFERGGATEFAAQVREQVAELQGRVGLIQEPDTRPLPEVGPDAFRALLEEATPDGVTVGVTSEGDIRLDGLTDTEALGALTAFADQQGRRIVTSLDADNDPELRRALRGAGFVPNVGRTHIDGLTAAWYREAEVAPDAGGDATLFQDDRRRVPTRPLPEAAGELEAPDIAAIEQAGEIDLYHVTLAENLPDIMASGELNNARADGNLQGFDAATTGVYGWTSLDRALFEIERAMEMDGSERSDWAIIKFRAPVDRLVADEDAGDGATWQESATDLLSVAVTGGVSLADIETVYTEGGDATLFQPAFHGSPHHFDRFSLDAIGTGEGAQAYGWGLYFASQRAVAEFYKDSVSYRDVVRQFREESPEDADLDEINEAIDAGEYSPPMTRLLQALRADDWLGFDYPSQAISAAFRDLESYDPSPALRDAVANYGNLYQVDIPEDHELLDWDKPLSEQPEGVREKLKRRITEVVAVDGLDMGGGSRLRDNRDGQVDPETPSPWLLETVSANGTSRFGLSQADVDRILGQKNANDLTGQQIYSRLVAEHGSQQAASHYLHSLGIPGLRYLDGSSRGAGSGSHNYVIWDEAAVTIEAVNDELRQARELKHRGQGRGNNTGKRGMIQFDPSRQRFRVTLLQNADLSTFLHESGHFYLEVLRDLVERGEADDALQADFRTLLDWMGVQSADQIGTEQHEQFARGFEAYLMEGRAPSPALQSVFARFRAWLIGIYRALQNLNVELTDEVRGVFDRLVATDEEIAAAEEAQNYQPLFEDAQAAGMSDEEFAAYREAIEAARTEAVEDVTRQAMNEVTRETRQWWNDRRAEVRREVEREVNQRPVYMAMYFLQRGSLPDGRPLPEGVRPMKLSKAALVDAYGEPFLKRLPRPYVYTREGGVHPDTVAPLFGFRSGDELVQALVNARPRGQLIEAETDARMRDQYGDIRTDGTLPDKALAAVHNEKRAQVMQRELQLLHRRANLPGRPTTLQVAKAAAARIIGQRAVRDIQPHLYRVAEAKAARQAFDAVAAGDFMAAAEAKRRQMLNHELYRWAREAREEIDKVVAYMRGFDRRATRERIGKAGADYLEQIDAILDRYDFSPISNRALDRRQALAAWVAEQEAQGLQVDVPEAVLNEARRVSYRELPLEELLGVRDTVKNIEHLAKLKNRLLANKKHRDLEAAVDDIVGAIEQEHGPGGPNPPNFAPGLKDKMGDAFSRFDAAHTKMEFLFRYLDGGEVGPVWEALFKPLADAEGAEQAMMREATERLRAIFGRYDRKERVGMYLRKVHVPEVGTSFTRASLLAVALNWGNAYNRDVLMRGYGWNETQVQAILSHLTAKDWDTVEAIWEFLDSYWPQIEQIQKDLTGLAPEKVEADPFTVTVNGQPRELRGGYYPIKYDAGLSFRQQQLEERQQTRELYGNNWLRPATRRGHTKERTDSGGKPVLLDLSVLTQHVTNVVHDLTHRRAILDIDRLIQHPRVAAAIEGAAGRAMHRELRPWLQSIANDIREPAGPFERILGHARMGATVVNMGWKITTAIVQPLGYFQSIDLLGEKYAWIGLRKFYGQSPMRQLETVRWVMEQSEMMRSRQRAFDRDVRDALKGMSLSGEMAAVQRSFFYLTGLLDMSVSVPTWLGAYQKAMDGAVENVAAGDRERAIDYADSVVRMSQSAGGAKDLARIQRGSEYHRIFTMFYSYFAVLYNLFKRRFQLTRGVSDLPRFAASMFYLWFVPAVLSELVAGRGPDDEDEWETWAAAKLIQYPFQAVVGLRDLVNAMGPYGYESSPVWDAFERTAMAVQSIAEAVATDEEFDRTDLKNAWLAASYWAQLPGRQMWITGSYLYDWMTGEEDPESFAEVLRGLAFARREE